MKASPQVRMIVVAGVSLVGSATFAQTRPTGASSKSAQKADAQHPLNNNSATQAGAMMQRTNGSLLKATLGTPPDPNQAKLSQLSFFAVPAPEPKTLKKHDLITIIIREESAFT